MTNKPNVLLVFLIVAALLGAFAYFIQVYYFDTQHGMAQIDYAINVSDDRELVGFSSDVFIGKVIEQTGSSNEPNLQTHFSVEIIESIKGNSTGNVTVKQFGGYEHVFIWRSLTLADGDELLRPGEIYLFVTKGDDERGYTFAPTYGNLLIEDQEDYEQKKLRFQKAYAEEIPFEFP
ncbi:hypothetical protein RE474_06685 [Methanolobus sediminis]|uniref:Uncharacterized protein n=1 Tax=Methanolobus sediminis TaxID=3072978 RepID=A0AA51UNN2_9EURY|nr:hypothetical protein [Methanolobus sediminis]WMW26388.1 hypothetical protein RE474_06685 [Methanolobus sediminis]